MGELICPLAMCMAFSAGFAGIGIWIRYRIRHLKKVGKPAAARVIGVYSARGGVTLQLEYETATHKVVSISYHLSNMQAAALDLHEPLDILYDPDNPERIICESEGHKTSSALPFGACIAFAGLSIVLLLIMYARAL